MTTLLTLLLASQVLLICHARILYSGVLTAGDVARRGHSKRSRKPTSERSDKQTLKNTGNAQYTGEFQIGGQTMNAVVDTGSFEILVLSTACETCGDKQMMYDANASATHVESMFESEHVFGSGTTHTTEGFDEVTIGSLKARSQAFWQVHDADMAILQESSFQAIFGVGPPAAVEAFATEDAQDAHKELTRFEQSGQIITDYMREAVHHYDDLEEHAKNSKSFVEESGLQTFSICLGKASGSEGYVTWADSAPQETPEKFTTVDVVGDYYWSAPLGDARFGVGEDRDLGCANHQCTAVLDSGTSLLVAPKAVVQKLSDSIRHWRDMGGTCDDVSSLPDLEFKLGDTLFSLPPESYVGQLKGTALEEIAKHMPRWDNKYDAYMSDDFRGSCGPLIMTIDDSAATDAGTTWILGMPFFKKYYTSFNFQKHDSKRPTAASMSFSIADGNCEPGENPAAVSDQLLARHALRQAPQAQMTVDASKLRMRKLLFPRPATKRIAGKSNRNEHGTK